MADLLNFGKPSGQKVPSPGIGGFPIARVLSQDFGLIVLWIKRNAQKHQVASHAIGKTSVHNSKIIRKAETIIGKRAMSVQERDGYNAACESREFYWLASL